MGRGAPHSDADVGALVCEAMLKLLHRELGHQGLLGDGAVYPSKLLVLVLMAPRC